MTNWSRGADDHAKVLACKALGKASLLERH
jgi:hypothetical protein